MAATPRLRSSPFPGLGDRIRIAMRRAGHRKFAGIAEELGVTESSLSRWCNGHEISLTNAVALARCLDVSLDWLVTGHEPDTLRVLPEAETLRQLGEVMLRLSELRDAPSLPAPPPAGNGLAAIPPAQGADLSGET